MQTTFGYAPLGPADGPVKTALLGDNVARLYGYDHRAESSGPDRLAQLKEKYERRGTERSNGATATSPAAEPRIPS